ncbi:small multidrug efflux protein [Actinoplanes solisilvae]|uniref:small multidrug efflux protein n=1 Tax=Actinoplanes solisilvae TaxID=2486853 RepID=UPI000FD885B4|nr:small multidrug efflux protein [Actinoplanes solisilvae]
MNPFETLVQNFRDLVAEVPELVQPFVVMLAGAIPFIEGEGASPIGVVGGIHPVAAGVAAAAGNFLCVLVVVLISSRARAAALAHGHRPSSREERPESKGRQRFRRYLVRFGVPGASMLGPLAIPTQFTAAMLIASGTSRSWVLLWQAIAIVFWTTLTTTLVWGVVSSVVA